MIYDCRDAYSSLLSLSVMTILNSHSFSFVDVLMYIDMFIISDVGDENKPSIKQASISLYYDLLTPV